MCVECVCVCATVCLFKSIYRITIPVGKLYMTQTQYYRVLHRLNPLLNLFQSYQGVHFYRKVVHSIGQNLSSWLQWNDITLEQCNCKQLFSMQ